MLSYILLILLLLFSNASLAIYDRVAINIIPEAEQTKFCFFIDTHQAEMYLALTTENQTFQFLSDSEAGLTMTAWQPPVAPPVFLKKRMRPSCFGPYPNTMLEGMHLYAGIGHSFDEIVAKQQYRPIYTLPVSLPAPEKAWTVMVYLIGADLEMTKGDALIRQPSSVKGYASHDILEMLAGSENPHLEESTHVVITTGGSIREGWKTVKRSVILNGQQHVMADLGEQSMAHPETLSDFVIWGTANFPAQHYALILWDHGGGTAGYGQDQSNAGQNQTMTLTELHEAYQTIRQQMDKPLDIILYDACLMSSLEVAEITATVANAMGGSIENEPEHGFDYEYMLKNIAANPPQNGIAFGKIVKTGYLAYGIANNNYKPLTYSILDLTQLTPLHDTFSQFTTELEKLFQDDGFFTYKMLRQGIIRAPGYPVKEMGKLLRSLDDRENIRIDFYNVLQTISPEYPQLKSYAEALQANLKQLVVDYEINDKVKSINPEAGRISLDIGNHKSYLAVLPTVYSHLDQTLDYYNQRRLNDTLEPGGEFLCPTGIACAEAKWWTLQADQVMSIDGYYGQQTEQGVDVYFIKPLYRYQILEDSLEIGVNGQETACQHQLCVNETECSNLTVTEQQGLWLADVLYNDTPAILTLCPPAENATHWVACSVVTHQNEVWGRDVPLSANDIVTPSVLHLQENELTQQQSQSLVVGETMPVVKKVCDMQTAVITANYFGRNGKQQFERLCDQGDCICKENDLNESCITTSNQFKAGVRIEVF
jgi:hypothetical protein